MRNASTTTLPASGARSQAGSRLLAACLCLAFGGFLLWGVGFSHSQTLHNAAHDTRHANGFPCH
ncbi:CbtB domain-containing protein [Roseomonas sp. E05]|uniref:CbtB domain-containing protein n=1 Tax=Roseomonas sp. E05 TaxID=3046310 RepID=UPI0024BACC61|nr:CbtB domain-containing protein [Roseomonas sp. E05]MDJ0391494.1 CbtB domain-containing protein [Roseomonas sp. E05]